MRHFCAVHRQSCTKRFGTRISLCAVPLKSRERSPCDIFSRTAQDTLSRKSVLCSSPKGHNSNEVKWISLSHLPAAGSRSSRLPVARRATASSPCDGEDDLLDSLRCGRPPPHLHVRQTRHAVAPSHPCTRRRLLPASAAQQWSSAEAGHTLSRDGGPRGGDADPTRRR